VTPSNASLNAFVALMREGRHAGRMRLAFDVLTKKKNPEVYFERLHAEGLLTTVPSAQARGGGIVLHDWPSAKFLAAVAISARTANNVDLCRQILGVVRAVTAEATNEAVADNYQIWVDCAHIVGQMPVHLIEAHDIASIQTWLNSRYDSSLVALELSKGLIPALLASEQPEAKARLVELLGLLTLFDVAATAGDIDERVRPCVDAYWLNEILSKVAGALGASCGWPAVDVLLGRLTALLEHYRQSPSWLHRPAIEENDQNFQRYDVKDALIKASRDAAAGFVQVAGADAVGPITDLLRSQVPMLFRIGLHITRLHFDVCQEALRETIDATWFLGEGRHELYLLLKERFVTFDDNLRSQVLRLLAELYKPEQDADDPAFRERYWLTVIKDSQDPRVLARLEALRVQLGPEHPDEHEGLMAYHESRWGDPPSPYSPSALRSLADQGTLVETLNAFEPGDRWDGPSVRSLVHALEKAVLSAPDVFLRHAKGFLAAKPAYQYGLLSGYAQLWSQGRDDAERRLPPASWEFVLTLTSDVLTANDVATSDETLPPLTPQATWLPGMVAPWIQSAVKEDDYAFNGALLLKARDILLSLLERLPAEQDDLDVGDAMLHAINSPRGKVIEALLAYCLRARRTGEDADAVAGVLARMETALGNANDLEAITLLAGAVPQLEYLHKGWVEAHASQLFRTQESSQLRWALQGLVHSSASRWLHALLRKLGVYAAALARRTTLGKAWESLIDRVLVAYLHGDEELDNPFWNTLLEERDYESLRHAAWFLWTQRHQPLTDAHRQSVVAWWLYIDQRVDPANAADATLKGALVRLLWAVQADDKRAPALLMDAARYARTMHHEYEFAEELSRFVQTQTGAALAALNEMLRQGVPVIDYQDTFYKLLVALHDAGAVEGAVIAANVMRDIPSIRQLFQRFQGRD